MAAPSYLQPTVWTPDQLAIDRALSIDVFVDERQTADPWLWAEEFTSVHDLVVAVFDATDNLREITADALLADPHSTWHILRYCCGPPVSEEDLWTFVGGPKFKSVPAAWADKTAEVFRNFLDNIRFPWVSEGRSPSLEEVASALAATTMPLAQQRFATANRGQASRRQELAVADILASVGFRLDTSSTELWVLDGLERGAFSRERKLAGDKCDLPVRLQDGRVLAIECKSSNGPKNGWKRLVREVGGKADAWKGQFGTQVVTAAVVSGVFDLACLERAQDRRVALFWEHDLGSLVKFVAGATAQP